MQDTGPVTLTVTLYSCQGAPVTKQGGGQRRRRNINKKKDSSLDPPTVLASGSGSGSHRERTSSHRERTSSGTAGHAAAIGRSTG
eukprot:352409-Chlamydomonas_euryale.AAC.5